MTLLHFFCSFQDEIQILKVEGDRIPLLNLYRGNQTVFICEKTVSDVQGVCCFTFLTVNYNQNVLFFFSFYRQLLSWYTLSQNADVSAMDNNLALLPLWVRCDMSDPAGTAWLGAETICMVNRVSGVKLYSVTCKGSTADKTSLITLDKLKQEHRRRHHPPSMVIKGSARFNLFGSTVVENTMIESQSSVTVDFKWSHVEAILETPPLSSTATLVSISNSHSKHTPSYFRYLHFISLLFQTLADGLRTGETEWMGPLESTSAVNLTKTTKLNSETDTPIFKSLLERGDLDFVEQLWVRMRKSVTSYQDIGDCLKLVTDAFRYGDIKPWIHRDSSSSLSKLILQSYHQQIDHVSLTGANPVHMLLEMGLDKMRRDYMNYLIGEELTTLNSLSYYLSTEVDLQEQVIRLRKLHHLLEIILTCSAFLGFPYDRLFLLTQSCLQHYKTYPYDEEHEFKLQIKPALISHFYQKEHPIMWGVEVSSGHGPREVRTYLQLSDRALVDHVIFETDCPDETVNGESVEPAFFSTMVCCSLVNFA
uniref:Protein zwilch n=1 Tax=Mola mola TaxID=94237 RepID=A0A3Q3VR57_MOLML